MLLLYGCSDMNSLVEKQSNFFTVTLNLHGKSVGFSAEMFI